MNVAEILDYATHHEIHLGVDGDQLVVDAPKGKMTDDLRSILKTHKHELLVMLEREAIARRHGLTLPVFREACGDDWSMALGDMDLADSAANAISTRLTRELGRIPPEYTSTTICAGCGCVHIFEGAPDRVMGCPWCHVRAMGVAHTTPGPRDAHRARLHAMRRARPGY